MKEYSYTFCHEKEKAYRPCGKYAFVKNDVFYWKRRGNRMGKCRIKKYRFPLLECGMFCINLNFYFKYMKPYPNSLPFHSFSLMQYKIPLLFLSMGKVYCIKP